MSEHESIAIQSHLKQIRLLHLVSAPLYFSFGMALCVGMHAGHEAFVRYALVSLLPVIFGLLLYLPRFQKEVYLPSLFAVIVSMLNAWNTVFQGSSIQSQSLYLVSVFLITNSNADVSMFLRKEFSVVLFVSTAVLYIVGAYWIEVLRSIYVVIPFLAFYIWRTFLAYRNRALLEQQAQIEQLKAFKATVVMLNHHFNNASAIALMNLELMGLDEEHPAPPDQRNLKGLRSSLCELVALIKKVTELERIEQEPYLEKEASGAQMVKLE